MTQFWPNPRAVEANKTSDTTSTAPSSKEMIEIHLVHAQVMIACGVLQLAFVILRSGGDAVDPADYMKFANAYDVAIFAIYASAVFMLVIVCLSGWIISTSKAYATNDLIQKKMGLFGNYDVSSRRKVYSFFAFLGLYLICVMGLGWLDRQKVITDGLQSAGMDLLVVGAAIVFFVDAVFRIRKAMKLMSGDKVV